MSHVDSKDDDSKEIFSLVDSNDSKESLPPKPKPDEKKKSDDFNDYEYSKDEDNPYNDKYDKKGSDENW